jgi:hypothetical protein
MNFVSSASRTYTVFAVIDAKWILNPHLPEKLLVKVVSAECLEGSRLGFKFSSASFFRHVRHSDDSLLFTV